MPTPRPDSCPICHTPMHPASTGRPRLTCSDRCRQALRRVRNRPLRIEAVESAREWRSADTALRRWERYTAPVPDPTTRTRMLIRLSRGIDLPWCPVCKKPFLRELGVRGHCSRECSAESRRRAETLSRALVEWAGRYDPVVDVRVRLNLPIKTCAQCDRPFNDYIRKKRYCSDRCRARAWRERRRLRRSKMRKCLGCSTRFLPHDSRHRYCTPKCYDRRYQRDYYRAHSDFYLHTVERPCDHCGKPFRPDPKNATRAKFCSRECNYLSRRKYPSAMTPRACEWCGKPCVINQHSAATKRYCSTPCRKRGQYANRKRRESDLIP